MKNKNNKKHYRKDFGVLPYLDMVLEDDDTPYGGVAFEGETLRDFMQEERLPYNIKLDILNDLLQINGIKRIGVVKNDNR